VFLCKLLYPFPKLSWFINSGNLKYEYNPGPDTGGEQNVLMGLQVIVQKHTDCDLTAKYSINILSG
jgi:hypothetical protein